MDKTRQSAWIFEEFLVYEAVYNTKINNQFTYILLVGCLDANGRKRAWDWHTCPMWLECCMIVKDHEQYAMHGCCAFMGGR